MATFKTPGVYVQEITTFAASVAAVPTAIPVFIGYTAQAIVDGQTLSFPTNPIRITSLLEYQQIFGGPFSDFFDVLLTGADVDIDVAFTNPTDPQFRLFYQLQMFFANGGGTCYIIAVDDYGAAAISGADLLAAITLAEQVDEITLVVVPEAMSSDIDDNERRDIYNEMLAHCAKMQDRFSIMDVAVLGGSVFNDGKGFRDNNVGANNLKYGAAYYPDLESGLSFAYADTDVVIDASDPALPANVEAYDGETLDLLMVGLPATNSVNVVTYPVPVGTTLTITVPGFPAQVIAVDAIVGANANAVAIALAGVINGNIILNPYIQAAPPPVGIVTIVQLKTLAVGSAGNLITVVADPPDLTAATPTFVGGADADSLLYSRITTALQAFPMQLYPSSTMAGIYAAVDNARGVWKAPANVSVNLVDSLGVIITNDEQADLNVDPSSGKSINAIRNFPGRGNLVWGARTLAGNDNEWRYVSVRRLFIFAEDSIRKASEFVVFEPNDKNTWVRVKSMISNFLTDLWRQGALTGDKPEQAYFVKVGLNETMTAQDILEGKMIIEVGLAAVRPAEFIILKFMHKMQEA